MNFDLPFQEEEMKWNLICVSKQKKLRNVKPSNWTEHWRIIYLFIDSFLSSIRFIEQRKIETG